MSALYSVLDRVQLNKWDDVRQQAVEGWQVRARWAATGTVLTVFIPLATYNPTEVDTAIRQAGYNDEAIGALGGSSA